jgi:hypothetical protein
MANSDQTLVWSVKEFNTDEPQQVRNVNGVFVKLDDCYFWISVGKLAHLLSLQPSSLDFSPVLNAKFQFYPLSKLPIPSIWISRIYCGDREFK